MNSICRDLHPTLTDCDSAENLWKYLEVKFGAVLPGSSATPVAQTRSSVGSSFNAAIPSTSSTIQASQTRNSVGSSFNAAMGAGGGSPPPAAIDPLAPIAAPPNVAGQVATIGSYFFGLQLVIYYGSVVPDHISCKHIWIPMLLSTLLAGYFAVDLLCSSAACISWILDS